MKIGYAISQMYPVGKYIIKEVDVNKYYILDENNIKEFEITEDKQVISITFKNKSIPYEDEPTPPKLPKTGW